MTPEQIHRRLILGTVFEYILKAAAAAGAIYLIGWFFSWLCSLITIGMIPFLMGLIEAIGIWFMWRDRKYSIELAEMEKERLQELNEE